jgi:hypothetical protein
VLVVQAGWLLHRMTTLSFPSPLIVDEIGHLPISRTMIFLQLMSRRCERILTLRAATNASSPASHSGAALFKAPARKLIALNHNALRVASAGAGRTELASDHQDPAQNIPQILRSSRRPRHVIACATDVRDAWPIT